MFSWNSKKQETVAQPTAEAEYIDAAAAVNQAIWFRKILVDLWQNQDDSIEIFCENQSAIVMAKTMCSMKELNILRFNIIFLQKLKLRIK